MLSWEETLLRRSGLTYLISDIISTVGPQGEHPDTLRAAYTNCLNKMKDAGLKSIVSLSHRSLSIFSLSDTVSHIHISKASIRIQ